MIFTSAALVSLNCPDAFKPFWQTIRNQTKSSIKNSILFQESLKQSAILIRETNLKTISFIGIAKSINSLGSFYSILKEEDLEILKSLSTLNQRRIPISIEENYKKAIKLWKSIYKPFDEKLIEKLNNFHPDLPIHILHSHYGALLSDPIDSIGPIGRIGTSLIAISSLRSTGKLGPQLTSHVFGLKKSLDEFNRNEFDGIHEVGNGINWLLSDDGVGWVIESVDKLSKLVEVTQLELNQLDKLPKSKL